MLNVRDTTHQFQHGQQTVGVNIVQIMDSGYKFRKGILLRAAGVLDPVPNTHVIWVGDATVTNATGMPVAPGETLSIPLSSGDHLYAVSTAAGQLMAWLGA